VDKKIEVSCTRIAMPHKNVCPYLLLLPIAIGLAYANTFQTPFIFDDQINIVENDSIRRLFPLSNVLAPPFGIGIAGRPIVNLTLALNYAVSGLDPWSYHLLNLLIHMAAALCLFGILRRTFLTERLKDAYGGAAIPLAFACSLLWAVHPLQTQSVTYIIQRCESLMGLCFLLTFYLAIRGWQSADPQRWHLAAIFSFLVGIGTKEVIAVAPVLLFFYNQLFFPDTMRNIIRRSPFLYAGLAFGLLMLGILLTGGGTLSSGAAKIIFTELDYWRTQPEVILHYLRLIFLPQNLSIDYAWPIATRWDWSALLSSTMVAVLAATALLALIKKLPIGFPAVSFFVLLTPTSLMPLPDAAFDHRMYLPSIVVVIILTMAVYDLLNVAAKQWIRNPAKRGSVLRRGSCCLVILAGVSLGAATYARNADYGSDASIWADAVRKNTINSRAHANLANALMWEGNLRSAVVHLYKALEIETENAHRYGSGVKYYEYLRQRPTYAKAQDNLGWAWLQKGNAVEASKHFEEALKVDENNAIVLAHMGLALQFQGKDAEAMDYLHKAIRIKPHNPDIRVNFGATLRLQGRPIDAIEHFQDALSLGPDNIEAHYGMGMALHQLGRESESAGHFREVMRLKPDSRMAGEAAKRLIKN